MSSKVEEMKLVKGRVVLMRKSVIETITSVTGLVSSGVKLIESADEYDITKSVIFKLISRTKSSIIGGPGKVGNATRLQNNVSVLRNLGSIAEEYDIYFDWNDDEMGIPGAFYVTNQMKDEFFLVSMTLEYPAPTSDEEKNKSKIHFVCNSWVHNYKCYKTDRLFFDNIPHLPGNQTPETLRKYREEELKSLRGDGTGERQKWDRIYDYDVYNDLGFLDSDGPEDHPILGGTRYPYPRRVRTGRKLIHNNNNGGEYETQGEDYYVPRDEKFSPMKTSEFLQNGTKILAERVEPLLLSLYLKTTTNEFNGFEEVQKLYEGGVNLPLSINANGTPNVLKFPPPHVIKESKFGWLTDEEFAREMIAGVNPGVIRIFKFEDLGLPINNSNQTSTITEKHLELNMGGLKLDEYGGSQRGIGVIQRYEIIKKVITEVKFLEQACSCNRLFVLDYHEAFLPYLNKINNLPSAKAYATKTFLYLKDDGTLKPLAIVLSKPGVENKVVLPADKGVESTIWLLAKAHVIVNDSNYHQLISHWYIFLYRCTLSASNIC
ncbi:unnamed protein product [Sphenostylis stenocarpa]|uniref:Lipoxygenase n=1 Tax=Sphenostylis stenocarpa TaxID=92480 RepID=A0AA86SMP9_9FABA|nr:unnamed protein product [Sphenostylis stenocarpa]